MQLTGAQNGGERAARLTPSVKPDDLSDQGHVVGENGLPPTARDQQLEGGMGHQVLYQPPEGPQTQAGFRGVGGFPLAETDHPRRKSPRDDDVWGSSYEIAGAPKLEACLSMGRAHQLFSTPYFKEAGGKPGT